MQAGGAGRASRKLRILCLHGFRTNGDIMRGQIAFSFLQKKLFSDLAEFVTVHAPHRTPAPDEAKVPQIIKQIFGEQKEIGYREWYNRDDTTGEYVGLAESIRMIEQTVLDKGPFDGVLGFSQGGVLTQYLMRLQQLRGRQGTQQPFQFRFGMAVACLAPLWDKNPSKDVGFGSLAPSSEDMIDTPMLFMAQEDDEQIPVAVTKAAAQVCKDSIFITVTSGGHRIPSSQQVSAEQAAVVFEFFRSQQPGQ